MPRLAPKPGEIAFIRNDRPDAKAMFDRLTDKFGDCPRDEAKVIVVLGGDGTMLEALRDTLHVSAPVYGLNCGTVGFLMNEVGEIDELPQRIATADRARINPLRMRATDLSGRRHEAFAINEIALLRQTHQTAHVAIKVNGQVRLSELVCDGVLLATPAGSTAYNLSAHGPILPIMANLLPLTPISAFRPRRWRGALLPYDAEVTLTVQDPDFRAVSATADNIEVRNVVEVVGKIDQTQELTVLFDAGASLEERIVQEQFQT